MRARAQVTVYPFKRRMPHVSCIMCPGALLGDDVNHICTCDNGDLGKASSSTSSPVPRSRNSRRSRHYLIYFSFFFKREDVYSRELLSSNATRSDASGIAAILNQWYGSLLTPACVRNTRLIFAYIYVIFAYVWMKWLLFVRRLYVDLLILWHIFCLALLYINSYYSI